MHSPLLLLSILLLAGCRDAPTDAIELRLHPEQGGHYRLWTLSEQTINGSTFHVSQKIGLRTTYEVTGLEANGRITLGLSCDSVVYRQESQEGVIIYNSADTISDLPDAVIGYAALYGIRFSVTITADGRVVDLHGTDAMRRGVIDRLERGGEAPTGFLERTIMEILSDTSLRESIEGVFAWYPDRAAGTGDSWNRREVLSRNLPINLDNEYEITSIAGGIIKLKVKASITSNPNTPPIDTLYPTIQYDLSGIREGTMEVDQKNGWVRSRTMEQSLEGSVEFLRGRKMPVTITTQESVRTL